MEGVRVHEEEESLGAGQARAVHRESGAGLKGKTRTRDRVPRRLVYGSMESSSEGDFFRACSLGTPKMIFFFFFCK